jgi:flagellar basal-body rod protein FlgG
MAIQALNSAATGLRALSTRIDVVANNLANAETTAFKRQRVSFEDLMYITVRQPGAQTAGGDITPTGIFVGLGTKISNTQLDVEQGSLENTGRSLDVAVAGPGFFRVKLPDTVSGGEGFTRNGSFILNRDGDLVVNIGDGYRIDPPINIPPGITEDKITISDDGVVSYLEPGTTTTTEAGRLQLHLFPNPQGLMLLGGSIYSATDASGAPIEANPGEDGAGTTRGTFIEGSNVDPVKELVNLIKTQRAFELNSQSVQTADQALQTIGNLRRF